MIDERKIEEALELDVTHISSHPDLWQNIRQRTEPSRKIHGIRISRWSMGMVAGLLLGALLLLSFWPTAPAWAGSLTLRLRDQATLLAKPVGGEEASSLPVEVDSYNALYYRWSPEGRYLVYGKDGDLFLHDAVSGEGRNLTNTPDRWELMPSWSPGGDTLAFASRPLEPREGRPTKPGADAWVMQGCFCGNPSIIQRDGSGYRVIEQGNTTNPPSWSSDGTILAYGMDGAIHLHHVGNPQVSIVRPSDYGLEAIYLSAPAFSPTRNELAVFFSQGNRPPTREEILNQKAATPLQGYAVLDLLKKQAKIVYQYRAPFVSRPPALWSSDGNELAFMFKAELTIAEPLGLIVTDREGQKAETVSPAVYQAEWEPAGSRLAYIDGDDERLLHILSRSDRRWEKRTVVGDEYLAGFAWWRVSR